MFLTNNSSAAIMCNSINSSLYEFGNGSEYEVHYRFPLRIIKPSFLPLILYITSGGARAFGR